MTLSLGCAADASTKEPGAASLGMSWFKRMLNRINSMDDEVTQTVYKVMTQHCGVIQEV